MKRAPVDVWMVVAVDGSRVEAGVYGVYLSEALAVEHRSRMSDPEEFEVEWSQALDVLDPVVFGGSL